MSRRRVPMRRCVGCGASRPKKELVRIVRTSSGEIEVDQVQRQAGRGAYLCPEAGCQKMLSEAKHRARLARAVLPHRGADDAQGAHGREAL
jgi:predicted RNA-binding protein YlxR (DUF448 family)